MALPGFVAIGTLALGAARAYIEGAAEVHTESAPLVHAVAPVPLYEPTGQAKHVKLEAAPTVALNVPAGQGVATKEAKGQKYPAGHLTGTPLAQVLEAGQGTQVSWRM